MSRRKRLKGAKPDAGDREFTKIQAALSKARVQMIAAAESVPVAVTKAIEDAVRPYQVMLAQQERDTLVAAHPGWGAAAVNPNVFPGVLV